MRHPLRLNVMRKGKSSSQAGLATQGRTQERFKLGTMSAAEAISGSLHSGTTAHVKFIILWHLCQKN